MKVKPEETLSLFSCIIKTQKIIFLGIILLIFLSCSSNHEPAFAPTAPPKSTYWNELARFLAGMPVEKGSKFYEVSQTKKYERHIKYMNKFWANVKKDAIDKITPWRKTNIVSGKSADTVFYPLSGADFVYLHSIFPDEASYLMLALEDPGDIHSLSKITPRRIINGLPFIRRVIYQYGFITYFTCVIMKSEMNNYYLRGIAPVLMVFLARMGMNVMDIESIGLDEAGKIALLDSKGRIKGKKTSYKGVRVSFAGKDDTSPRKIVYMKMWMKNYNVGNKTPGGLFLNSFDSFKTMMKAAIYLFHRKKYFPVKDFILKKSTVVVQDDSGIPYRFFGNEAWDVKLYGVYKPLRKISGTIVFVQPGLAKTYKLAARELPFHYGYGAVRSKKKSNLMVAEKKL